MKKKLLLKRILLILFMWFSIHVSYTIGDGLRDENKSADVGVIMGNKVNEDGTLSARLIARLDCGLNLYESGRIKRIIVSGGLGKEGFYEGDKMKEFLIQKGVPDSSIIIDNLGNNTLMTVKNILALKAKLPFSSVIVISQYYHLTRSKMLFRKAGFKEVSSVSPYFFELRDVYSLIREFFAYYRELIWS